VSRDGRLVGQDCSDATLQEVADLTRRFEPSITPVIKNWAVDAGRQIIAIQVRPHDAAKPYVFDGKAYERVANTTRAMSQETYRHRLLSRSSNRRWEMLETDLRLDDLDTDEILRTIRLGIEIGRVPESAMLASFESKLQSLGLMSNGRVVNAAVVLFGKEMMPSYAHCLLRLARFKGTTKSEFLDNRQVRGHAFHLLTSAQEFLRQHLPIASQVKPDDFVRSDRVLYPLQVVREALVNALCHRDYVRPGGSLGIALYDDRLEISNEGTLPDPLTLADLRGEHPSKPRNQVIANAFYRRGLLESWGRGTLDMIRLCINAGHPEPEFLEKGGCFTVRFLPIQVSPAAPRAEMTALERRRRFVDLLRERGPLAFKEIRASVEPEAAERTMRDALSSLKKSGTVRTQGFGRGAVWSIA